MAAYEAARAWATGGEKRTLFHAVGLAANEFERPPMLFEAAFQRAQDDGLHVTMHCDVDQKGAVAHVREAIFAVCRGRGAERIDHGLNAIDSPELIDGLRERGIPLTLCPHAYHRRQSTEVLFPKIRRLLDAGVKISINSDDPTLMHNVWVDGNLQKVYTYCKLSKAEVVGLIRNAVEMSWADQDTKASILHELDSVKVD